jgi:dinuclear metal center YbgI/SA1388 family protein
MSTVADMIALMDAIAPPRLAEDWDNPGLQFGDPGNTVSRVMVSLDPTPAVIQGACDAGAELLITHHPLFFQPLKKIDLRTPLGKMITTLARHGLAVFCAHTNLDAVSGGLNDIFAEMLGLRDITVLCPSAPVETACKLVVYAPKDHCPRLLDVFFAYDQGVIGQYSCCTFRQAGTGTFKPGPAARPLIGGPGEMVHADEYRIEATIKPSLVKELVAALRDVHPYETMAWDVYPLYPETPADGLGRIGVLPEPMDPAMLARTVKSAMGIEWVRVAGVNDRLIRKVAVCTGSGSGLLQAFFASGADALITGDLRYHDARELEMNGRIAIDVGHFPSERLMIELIRQRLAVKCREHNYDVIVDAWPDERDPFVMS